MHLHQIQVEVHELDILKTFLGGNNKTTLNDFHLHIDFHLRFHLVVVFHKTQEVFVYLLYWNVFS